MRFLRNLPGHLFAVYALLVFLVTMLVVWLPIFIISFFPEPQRARFLHPVFRLWMGVYMPMIFCPVSRKGKEKFRKGENYVVVLNHNSFMDIPISSPWIPGPNKTLAKIEIAKVPLFGIIYKTGSILLDRKSDKSRRQSVIEMQQTLEMGVHLCLYPEGTRNKTNNPIQPFFDGAFISAVKAQKPVMPGLIFNTARVLPLNRKFWASPKRVAIHFLDPIPTIGLDVKDVPALKAKVHGLMETYFVNNKAKA